MNKKQNANPVVFAVSSVRRLPTGDPDINLRERSSSFTQSNMYDEHSRDVFDELEIFEHLRHINDPEHPLTLEQLKVVQLDLINVSDEDNKVSVSFTPTIPHCSMATLIGLCIRVKLIRSLPPRFKVDVFITPGTHVCFVLSISNLFFF